MLRLKKKESVMKSRLVYTGLILFVYILGRRIPLYGINFSAYAYESVDAEELLMQTVSGGAYRASIFALGFFPYMISGLLVQMMLICRNLVSKVKVSPKKIGRITVTATLVIAILQAFVQVTGLEFNETGGMFFVSRGIAVMEMVTGAMLIMWLSDRNSRFGIGERMILGVVNILERIGTTVTSHSAERLFVPVMISVTVMMLTLVMENAEKRIPMQRISIHNIYADKNYLAIKLNPVGVMPVMFSTAVFMLPQLVISLLAFLFPQHGGVIWWQENLTLTKLPGILVYIGCEYLLTVGFAMLMLNPKETAEQLLKSGDSMVDIHAGRDTRRYLRGTLWRIGMFSATVMGLCMAAPLLLQLRGNIDSTLVMLPSSVMMLTGLWCNIYREVVSVHRYDACRPLF